MVRNSEEQQARVVKIALIVMLAIGAVLLRKYFGLIVVAAIMSYLSNPIYIRLKKRTKRPSVAATLTFALTVVAIVVPLILVILLTIFQIRGAVENLPDVNEIDLGALGTEIVDQINRFVVPLPGDFVVTYEGVVQAATNFVTVIGHSLLNFLSNTVSSIPSMITSVILYLYVYLNILLHQDELIRTIKRMNPLGEKVSEDYLSQVGAMTTAMVRGQFIIAFLQGLTGAISLAIIGLGNLFFPALAILTALSIIPLGGGILIIPLGIGIALFGDVWQGLFLLFVHFFITTNIDNVLRPRLVPKSAQLNSALIMLSVFGGIALFGFLGIIIGPVLMVLIASTIRLYLAVKYGPETA